MSDSLLELARLPLPAPAASENAKQPEARAWNGPRSVPKPDKRRASRRAAKQARKANRR